MANFELVMAQKVRSEMVEQKVRSEMVEQKARSEMVEQKVRNEMVEQKMRSEMVEQKVRSGMVEFQVICKEPFKDTFEKERKRGEFSDLKLNMKHSSIKPFPSHQLKERKH